MNNNNTSHTLRTDYVLEGALYKYKIKKVLGQGSFGITYLANVQMKGKLGTLDSNMTVAIKEFYMRDINGRNGETVTSGNKGGLFDDYKKKFEREAANLSKLEHPNIVKVLESFEANGTIYYIMEYIDGVSLDKKIEEKKRLDYKTCIKYTKQIGSALAFMHQEHMLHLDVKPANVMLRNSDDVVLIDFGLSKQYDENGEPESSTKVGGGTPGYAPLEQANYHEGKDFPVVMDVYALGGTMFKMLSGCRPPEASDILNDGFPEKDLEVVNVPQQLIGCIERAMNPTKKSRYQTISSFIDAIESVKNEIETSEETTVEVDIVDDMSEAEIVDVQKVDSKTYQVHITNNGQTLSSVHLSDKIYNLKPEEGEIDINKDFTYQQALNGEAGSNIVADLRGETIEITYRFGIEKKSIKFVFNEVGKEIPFSSIMPVLEFNGTIINIPSDTYTFQGKEIYGLKRIKSRGTEYRIKRESENLDLRRLQDTCIIQVEHVFSINVFFNQPEDKPKCILFKSTHGEFPFTDVTNHLEAVLPGYQEEYSYYIASSYYEDASGSLTSSGTKIQLPHLKPASKLETPDQPGKSKLNGVHVNTKINKRKNVKYYYGIGTALLIVIVALYWWLNRPVPNNPIQQTDRIIQHIGNPMPSNSDNVQNSAPRLFNNSYYWNGNWEGGKPNGEGVITYLSKDKDGRKEYKGYVSNGLRNDNSAVLTYTNGNSFNGSFVNDKLNKGKLILRSDGMYFEGSFKDNQPYNGKWYYTDGSLYSTVTNGVEK